MNNRIKINVEVNGKNHSGDYAFSKGVLDVSGENGSKKTHATANTAKRIAEQILREIVNGI